MARRPMDIEAYTERTRNGPCFICALVAGEPGFAHEVLFEDDDHIAFLDRYPTLAGRTLVAPKAHLEHVVRDLDEAAYSRTMLVVREVALAVEDVFEPERTYLLSLGSQQGNSHLHWHIAALPSGVPYEEQQFHALMTENGILDTGPAESAAAAERVREAIRTRGRLRCGRGGYPPDTR
ncbi:HIT family protein [Nocardiopsis valliformis]|uniref:HIT family protein n=1 Tax=Nocardiopsis valliformis TaxID=239974 RepID=UPI00034D4A22|nr:HIT family protein [Nocardiopsis valliformis]